MARPSDPDNEAARFPDQEAANSPRSNTPAKVAGIHSGGIWRVEQLPCTPQQPKDRSRHEPFHPRPNPPVSLPAVRLEICSRTQLRWCRERLSAFRRILRRPADAVNLCLNLLFTGLAGTRLFSDAPPFAQASQRHCSPQLPILFHYVSKNWDQKVCGPILTHQKGRLPCGNLFQSFRTTRSELAQGNLAHWTPPTSPV